MRHHWRRSQFTVPVSRCLSAASVRFSGLPAPAGELSLSHVRPTGGQCLPDPIGVVTFRLAELRPGWVPPGPRGRWFAPGRPLDPGRHLPPSSGGPCSPASCIPPAGVHLTGRHRRFTHVHPSGLPPACAPQTEQGPLGLSLGSAPRGHPQRTPGREQSLHNWTGNYVPDMSRSSFCEFHSLQATSCRTHRWWYRAISASAGYARWSRRVVASRYVPP